MKKIFQHLLVLFILLQPAITKADPGNGNQNGNGNGGNGNHNGWGGGGAGDGGVPLDGGISLLVAAGVGYGAKKMAAKKKAAEEAEQVK